MNRDIKLKSGDDDLEDGQIRQADAPSHRSLIPTEELQLLQLLQKRYWGKRSSQNEGTFSADVPKSNADAARCPDEWATTLGLELHQWQQRAVDAWFANRMRGIAKVVTGAGKTVLALAIIEALQRKTNPDLRVAVVVPTIVLMDQWADELAEHSNLPSGTVGLLGAGRFDHFDECTRVLICVLNSAAKRLAAEVERSGVAKDLLLIVDECHRAGAPEMKRIFRTRRSYALGLSATPERDDQDQNEEAEIGQVVREYDLPKQNDGSKVLREELGEIVVDMNYDQAIKLGVLPSFRIVHYGLQLNPLERERYDRLSRQIRDLRESLETRKRRGLALIRWCRSKAAAHEPRAARLLALTVERKQLLYRMSERAAAVVKILHQTFATDSQCKAILFHESIDEVMRIFEILRQEGFAVIAEHSEFPDQIRADSLRLFRQGTARVIVSARSLIEGFNVPSADIGIVVAASSSVRQRVQTLGRLLRKNTRADGSAKIATLYTLYASNTADELIYEKFNWNDFTGASRNEFFQWPSVANSEPVQADSAPRTPLLPDSLVDSSALRPGLPYPGDSNEGSLYSVDLQKTITTEAGEFIEPNPELTTLLCDSGMLIRGGRFRITPLRNFVIKLEKNVDGWQSIFLGKLDSTPRGAMQKDEQLAQRYSPGDAFPLSKVKGVSFRVLPRDKRLVAERGRRGTRFVKQLAAIDDAEKRNALRQIQEELGLILSRGRRISKFTVTPRGDAVYVFENHAYFIGNMPQGPSGFEFEE